MSSDREEAEADCGDPKFGFVDEMTSVVPFNLMLSGLPKSVIWIGWKKKKSDVISVSTFPSDVISVSKGQCA